MRLMLILAALMLTNPLAALAAKRLGLIIGNDAYSEVPKLDKARGDADAMSEELRRLGFDTITRFDATRREMNAAIAEFTARLQPGDTALVFYAGHGVEIDGENYLLPTDIATPSASGEDFVKYESIALGDLLNRIQSTGARTTLVFLDACRDNPFKQVAGRSIGGARGLARVVAPEGTFVVFSAGANQQALDRLTPADDNRNSVFTRLLLPKLRNPDLELRTMISELRVEVRDLALSQNHAQFPAYYDELLGDFYFTPTRTLVPADAPPAAVPPGAQAPVAATDDIRADFALAERVGTAEAYQAFLERYAGRTGDFSVTLARQQLARLTGEGGKPAEGQPEQVAALSPAPDATSAPQPAPAAPTEDQTRHLSDRVAIIRATQAKLNALGCNAGGADGVAGPRTRAAFADFIRQSGERLRTDALGSQHALDVIESYNTRVCRAAETQVAAAPAPSAPPANVSPAPAPVQVQPAAPSQASLAGTWSYSAQCLLLVFVKGTTILTEKAPNVYALTQTDSLGNRGTGTLTVSGNTTSARISWNNGVRETNTGRISNGGRTIKGTSNTGCGFTATR